MLRQLSLSAAAPESPEGGLFKAERLIHARLLERLESMAEDDDVKGLLLRVGEFGGSFARAAELRTAFGTLREHGKPIHCYFETTDNLGYALLASSCDRITMTPGGLLDLVGVGAEVVYARELLEGIGLTAELMQVGRFKGAADTFTRDDMPPEVRQNMDAMLDDLHGELLGAIAEGRGVPKKMAQAWIDGGPYTADAARRAGLVDDVGFDDEARAHALEESGAKRVVHEELDARPSQPGLGELIGLLMGGSSERGMRGPRLVLAFLEGTITRGQNGGAGSGEAESFVKAMRRFADDEDVRALVLRIDSPGGSAMASDLMWHALRRVAKRKPVVISVGDMAASGGYYVAAAGTTIFAERTSLLGSIGVVGGKIVAADLGERAGLNVARLGRGKNSGWLSPLHHFSDDERAAFQRSLDATYRLFLRRIAQGRKMAPERLEPLAQGRLLTGIRAHKGGLVDELGGLPQALEHARTMAEFEDDEALELWPPHQSLLQQLGIGGSGAALAPGTAASVLTRTAGKLSPGIVEALLQGDDPRLASLPFVLTLR
ncbi:MAG: signal peptide peptidase SppA [Myxococcales bacterium]|nr:signal peptide peptidase SppA [Myxococcales bacterium]